MRDLNISKIRHILFFIIFILAVLGYMALTDESILDPCDATVLSSSTAPDGRTSVIVFERECGATTPFNTQASLVPVGKAFSLQKNPPFLILSGKHTLGITWATPSAVEIGIPNEVKSFKKDQSVGDFTIVYK
ncbi:hypothetical protein [Azospirillum doebereinerae]|uniref:Uncharacterized protein n=1 Tax=Azospirillum doebereinerae TaxID=92933 RepID=A0A3S0X809_9PROT|nr:hypothetical protein [Azospirillum doebereinerae]RUQ65207.1 hypothetical protein EJ913_25140 [Azospirillum doebereinerae]